MLLDDEVAAKALVYGPDPGQDSLRASLAKWLSDFYQPTAGPVSPDRLFITNGASGALPMLLTRFTEPGYTRRIWMIEPTYFLACPSFQDAGFEGRLRGVPEDDEGIDVEFLRSGMLEAEKEEASAGLGYDVATAPKVYRHIIYVVPTFSNPSAKVMSRRRREQLVALAREFDALVISDDVYDWLRWPSEDGKAGDCELLPPLPRLVDVDRAMPGGNAWGNVVSNGSFSKIVAPGVRVGWIEGGPEIPKELCKLGPVRSGGCQGHLSSMFMGQLLSSGALDAHIQNKLIPTYRTRYQAMMKAIHQHLLPLGISIAPTVDDAQVRGKAAVAGGFFTYLNLPGNSVTSKELAEYALEKHNVRAAHGGMMTVAGDEGSIKRAATTFGPGLRLCWAWHEVEEIEEGVERLATAFKELQTLS